MKMVIIVSSLVMSFALNAQTIQGKVVRVANGDATTILDLAKRVGVRKDANPIPHWEFRKRGVK